MPWKPSRRGERPTLGWLVLDWIIDNLARPGIVTYEPFIPTDEQARFLLKFYELDPVTGRRIIRRGVISRPRGWGKSPFLAAIACAEAMGPVVFDGWNGSGQPVGRPWSVTTTPLVQLAAVSELQTKNSWTPLLQMLRQGPVMDNYHGLDPLDTFIVLPVGRIERITSSAHTAKGNPTVYACLDQTEEWTKSNGGVALAQVMRSNAGKINGSTIESPNAFVPGNGSVAESTAAAFSLMREGKTREQGVLYDHREAPAETDLSDRESLLAGLRYAYGDSAEEAGGWVNLERLLYEIWDPSTDIQVARSDFLNQITHASDAWITQPEWNGCSDPTKVVADKERITLGFDGSRKRAHSVTDATALIGCRLSDGHLFQVAVWEQPDGPAGKDWQVSVPLVEAKVAECFDRWDVVGFYADPAKWETIVAGWEGRYGPRLKVKVSGAAPIQWWMTGGRSTLVTRALTRFHSAVVDRQLSHCGSYTLARHVLNARMRTGARTGYQIAKAFPESPDKIDAAVAAVLAFEARTAAVTAGLLDTQPEPVPYVPRRIR